MSPHWKRILTIAQSDAEKENLILDSYKSGEIEKLGKGCYSVSADLFVRGITPRIVAEVLNGKENAQNK